VQKNEAEMMDVQCTMTEYDAAIVDFLFCLSLFFGAVNFFLLSNSRVAPARKT
jgi:hypothetical protein